MFNLLFKCIDYYHRIQLDFSLCLVVCKDNRDKFADMYEFARAILTNPYVLILDEPFDGIDITSRHNLIQMFRHWIDEKSRSVM